MSEKQTENKKQLTIKLNVNMIILSLLSILVIISVVQTITLTNLIGKKQPDATSNSSGTSDLPAALKNIPQQVGGC